MVDARAADVPFCDSVPLARAPAYVQVSLPLLQPATLRHLPTTPSPSTLRQRSPAQPTSLLLPAQARILTRAGDVRAAAQAEAEDEPLAVSHVVLTPVGRLQLANCWRRNGGRTLYRSAQDFVDFVCQASQRLACG